MHGKKQAWASQGEVETEINVIPLVDVLLVLLVIFMITAPIITQTLPVQLPKSSLKLGAQVSRSMVVTIDRKGVLALNQKVVGYYRKRKSIAQFEKHMLQWKAQHPDAPAFLRADRRLRYQTVILIMSRLRKLGIDQVGLMFEQQGK